MATLEDLGRMAMVEVEGETAFAPPDFRSGNWGKMALLLAASAAVCGIVVGLKSSQGKGNGQ